MYVCIVPRLNALYVCLLAEKTIIFKALPLRMQLCLSFLMSDLHSFSSHQHLNNMVGLNSINSVPNWLLILKEEKFFTRCLIHDSVKKNEKNTFCLDCCTSICPHCHPLHRPHVLLQIRRYMYKDVIRLGDAQKLLNCSLVQAYTTNRTKVLFLKRRPTSRSLKGSGNLCIICDRSLQVPYIYCSLSCKVHHQLVLITKSTTIKYEFSGPLVKERSSTDNNQEIEDSQITPDSVLDSPTWKSLSGSTATSCEGVVESLNSPPNSTAELLKIKRSSSVQLVPRIWLPTAANRRKGVPHRSPLY